jgi:NADPH2:quinone reductase
MRAIQLRVPGGPEALEVAELPTPEPAPGEVRVRAEAIGVGRPDVLVRKGVYKWMPPLPTIPGAEMVGVIDRLGEGVQGVAIGERVLVSARELPARGGCYAEAICVPASALYAIPAQVQAVDAASLPNFQFALALFRANGGLPVRSVLVPGAAGGVGSALTQVARARNVQVLGTASSEEKRVYARANGVDHLVQGDPQTLSDEVRTLTGGRGVDLAFDHLGGRSIIACLHALAPMGMVVSYNIVQGPPSPDLFMEMRALLGRSLAVRAFSMHTLDAVASERRALMNEAIALLASGQVKAPPAQVLRLDQVVEAHRMLDAASSIGKIVLVP